MISSDNVESITITYDAGGNPVKLEEYNSDYHNIYTYTYNNGSPVSGTFKSWELASGDLFEDDVLTYTVSNGLVTAINWTDQLGGNNMSFVLSYANGNLVKVQDAGNMFTANFTFGNKKPVFPKVFNYIMDQAGYSMQFFARNEILSMSFDFPGTVSDFTSTMQYTYDADGYVLTSNDGTSTFSYQYQ